MNLVTSKNGRNIIIHLSSVVYSLAVESKHPYIVSIYAHEQVVNLELDHKYFSCNFLRHVNLQLFFD